MKAGAYLRVSSEHQIDNWSIPAQKREFEDYCNQKGWQPVRIYPELGLSAHTDSIEKRPQFKKLLEDCRNGELDVVVVHSLDRWSRNLRVTLETFKQLAEYRIAFVSITENIDYSTPEGRLFIAMIGAFAQYFSDSLAKHTSKGMKQRAVSGFQNGDVPFGYQKCKDCQEDHGGKVHLIDREAEAVRKLFQLYASGGWSLSKLAGWLNEQGFRTRNKRELRIVEGETIRGPLPFSLYSVRWILHNPFFTGKVKYREQLFKGAHDAIVDEKLFEKVQEKLKQARTCSRSVSSSFRLYLLKGIARCIYCGYPVWCETSSNNYTYYREHRGHNSGFPCPSNGKAVRTSVIDEQVESLVKSLTLEPLWRERVIAKLSTIAEHENVERQRKQLKEKLRRIAKAYIDGIMDDGEYNVQRKLMQDAVDSLVIPEAEAALDAGSILESLGLIWQNATLEEKHRLLTGMLEAVYVDLGVTRSIVGVQPKPPFYPLFESLKQKPENKVTVFNPNEINAEIKITGYQLESENFGLVETGEG